MMAFGSTQPHSVWQREAIDVRRQASGRGGTSAPQEARATDAPEDQADGAKGPPKQHGARPVVRTSYPAPEKVFVELHKGGVVRTIGANASAASPPKAARVAAPAAAGPVAKVLSTAGADPQPPAVEAGDGSRHRNAGIRDRHVGPGEQALG